MPDVFSPIEELKRHGLCEDSVSADAERILSTMTREQVEACIEVKRRVDVLQEPALQERPIEDGSLALAMTRAMGWDRPDTTRVAAEVEAMSATTVAECLCLCTGSGGGGGGSLD